jgi:hypothetical protein
MKKRLKHLRCSKNGDQLVPLSNPPMTAPFVDNSTPRHLYVRYCLHAHSVIFINILSGCMSQICIGVPSPWSQQTDVSVQHRPDHIRDAADTRILQSYVILRWTVKAGYLPGWQINNFYIMARQHPANSDQGCLGVRQDGSWGLPLTGSGGPCWWIWGSA